MEPNKWLKRIVSFVVLAAISMVVLFVLYHGIDLSKPLIYSEDGVSATYLVKTIKETGWFLNNPSVGGIYGASWADYTMCDNLSFLLVKFFALFSDNCFVIFNLFYFSTFLLVAWAAYAVFRIFKVNRIVSMAGALLYSFQAFHQLRLQHVWLTPYFLVPFGLLVGIWLATDAYEVDALTRKSLLHNRKLIASTVILFLSAFTGFYYAFFTCIVLCIAGVILLLQKWSGRRLLFILYHLFAVCAGVLANVYPSLIYWMQNGMNDESELVVRGAQGAEIYAFKLIQLLMPRMGHRSGRLAAMAKSYFEQYPLNNENQTATLGVVGALGFLLLLLLLFRLNGDNKLVRGIKLLNVGILLTAVIGGIGGVFSYFVSTPMRCYNRLSIYIAFLALLYLALAFTSCLERIGRKGIRMTVCVAVSVVVLVIGLWDQTVSFGRKEQTEAAESFESDRSFVQAVEKKMPAGTMIYQMPLVKFPSGGTYELFKGYMHSKQTVWSYGGMQGREQDKWETNLLNYDTEEFLHHICYGGYRGLYLDKVLMKEQGYDFEAYRQVIETETGETPIVSEDKRLYFYDLTNYNDALTRKLGEQKRKEKDDREYKVVVNFMDGFYERGKTDTEISRWSKREGTVTVTYAGENPCPCTFTCMIYSGSIEQSQMTVTVNGEKQQVVSFDESGTRLQIPLKLEKGKNVIRFESSAKDINMIEEDKLKVINFQLKHPVLSYDGE